MALVDGDYIVVRDQIIATFNADTGSGGLKEDLGGGVTSVLLIEGELRSEPRLYKKHEIPAIAISVGDKDEKEQGHMILKSFAVICSIFHRGLDEESVITKAKKITHRAEKVIRDQDRLGVTAFIDLSAVDGWEETVDIKNIRTSIVHGKMTLEKKQQDFAAIGTIEFVLEIGTCFAN